MEEEKAVFKANSLLLCDKLLRELQNNKEDTELFFGGDMHRAYIDATDHALNKVRNIRAKIRNL